MDSIKKGDKDGNVLYASYSTGAPAEKLTELDLVDFLIVSKEIEIKEEGK